MDTYIGFDSAWTDSSKVPGAICAMQVDDDPARSRFHHPRLVSFSGALTFIEEVRSTTGATLLALDQPTIVPNSTSMRPVERAAASLVSWLGGGVQPSNTSKVGMFCPASPIWRFLGELGATENPEDARTATSGLHLIEVFPALALPSIDPQYFGRLAAPRYNPERRKTFRLSDWHRVVGSTATAFETAGFPDGAEWCRGLSEKAAPRKADQDRLDSMLCLLVALSWRLKSRDELMMLGCLESGYMVLPASTGVRDRLTFSAEKNGVPVDGCLLSNNHDSSKHLAHT